MKDYIEIASGVPINQPRTHIAIGTANGGTSAALEAGAYIRTVFRNGDMAAAFAPEYAFDSNVDHHLEVLAFHTIWTANGIKCWHRF